MIITFIWKDTFWFNASKLAYQISARKRAPNWLRSLSGRKALQELTSKMIDNHRYGGLNNEQLFKKDDNQGLWFHETLMPHFCRWLGERVTEAFYRAMILKSKESCGTVEINVEGLEREVKVTEEPFKTPKEHGPVNEREGDRHLAGNNTGNLLKRKNEQDLIHYPEDKVKRHTLNVGGPSLSNERFSLPSSNEVSKNGWPVLVQTSLYFCRTQFEENGGILSTTNAKQSPLPFPKIQYVHPSNRPPVVTVNPYQPANVVLQKPSHPTMNTLMYSKEFLNAKQQELDRAKEMLELEQKKLETMHKHRFFQLWISTKINKASK